MSAVTELQSLEREMVLLKKILKSCQSSTTETTSVAAVRIYHAITTCATTPPKNTTNQVILDHFAPVPIPKGTTTSAVTGTSPANTPQRTTYNADEPSGGCCVVC